MTNTRRRGILRFVLLPTIIALAATLGVAGPPSSPASAAPVQGFNPGNIIADSLFYDGNAMSAAEVQTFLNQRVPRCTIGDPGRTAGMAWGTTRIADKCMRDFSMTTISRSANALCDAYVGRANETAAEIIAKVGQACGISQRVLLVTLEKEQSLVSDSWPTERQLAIATGYACPDSGPNWSANCNPEYYGFQNQVYYAAWQLKLYRLNPQNYNFKPFQVNTIQYHPNPACGSSQVRIENWATAALYIYTPYQPNAASLAAGWGTGDSCSTYGNRNFYNLYTQWFGPTQQQAQHAYADSITGRYNGIRVTGWARKLTDAGTATVGFRAMDGNGNILFESSILANRNYPGLGNHFPGWGDDHGFDQTFSMPGGNYVVQLYNQDASNEVFGSAQVYVPVGQGYADSITQAVGGIRVTGWSVDFRTPATPDTIRVVLDGTTLAQTWSAGSPTDWIDGYFPGMGNNHAFDFVVPASAGSHTVCLYGAGGLMRPCSTVNLIAEHGWIDTVEPAEGGVRVTGWALGFDGSAPIDVRLTVNGQQHTVTADRPLDWFDAYYPGAGANHGIDAVIPLTTSGTFEFCIVGERSGRTFQCTTRTVQLPQERGHLDALTAGAGTIRAQGWSHVVGNTGSTNITVTIDGQATTYAADKYLAWFDPYFPGSGNNHGFDITIPVSAGTHNVCVSGAARSTPYGCKTLTVAPAQERGYLDALTAGAGTIRAQGWSHMTDTTNPTDITVTIDGQATTYAADKYLAWFDPYFPGSGNNHGFDITIPVSAGTHNVCVSGAARSTPYGCKTLTVAPAEERGYLDGVVAGQGTVRVHGWSHVTGNTAPTSIILEIDGQRTSYPADKYLAWFDPYFPGSGNNHGFDVTVPAGSGTRNVCVYGAERLTAYGCTAVSVR